MGAYVLRRILNYVILLFIAITLSYFLAATTFIRGVSTSW